MPAQSPQPVDTATCMHSTLFSQRRKRKTAHRSVPARVFRLLLLLTGALIVAAGCVRKAAPPPAPPVVPPAAATAEGFVGDAACAACHAAEDHAHRSSRHALTMRAADPAGLGGDAPHTGVVPLAGYSVQEQPAGLVLTRSLEPARTLPLQLALGSGKTGITFIAFPDQDTLLQVGKSYFPSWHLWDSTPGQEQRLPTDDLFGRVEHGDEARKCLSCHTIALPSDRLTPEPRFFGVGCESCHGPGQAHIEAVRAGDLAHLQMEKLGAWKPDRLDALCGKCHRTASNIDLESPETTQTHRFQPYALLRARCRTRQGDVLSCLMCHNPHTDVSTDLKSYEAACLKCHSAAAVHPATTSSEAHVGHPCPVNAHTGCIDCHMRPRKLFPNLDIPVTMVDHLISLPPKTSQKPVDLHM